MAAVTYPVLVFLVAWGGIVFFSRAVAPGLAVAFASFHVPGQRFITTVVSWGRSAIYWGPAVPIVVVLLWAVWWFAFNAREIASQPIRLVVRLAAVGRPDVALVADGHILEILALLVENQMPLEEAVILAAQASGDPQTLRSAQRLAAALQQGRIEPARGEPAFPPLIAWLMFAARRDGALLPALRHAAAAYHRRARYYSDMARTLLPVLLTLVIGGTITAVYALTLFVPYTTMLRALSKG